MYSYEESWFRYLVLLFGGLDLTLSSRWFRALSKTTEWASYHYLYLYVPRSGHESIPGDCIVCSCVLARQAYNKLVNLYA